MKDAPALDERLQRDCIPLGRMASGQLLLMNNRHFPWLVLVPDTHCTELHQLEPELQQTLLQDINRLSLWLVERYQPHKINTAAIGNIVSQMHIHIIARFQTDPCWPGVVWGNAPAGEYEDSELAAIRSGIAPLLNPAGE